MKLLNSLSVLLIPEQFAQYFAVGNFFVTETANTDEHAVNHKYDYDNNM